MSDSPRNRDAEPAFMRGYGDWSLPMTKQNDFAPGSEDHNQYELGWEDARADDREAIRKASCD